MEQGGCALTRCFPGSFDPRRPVDSPVLLLSMFQQNGKHCWGRFIHLSLSVCLLICMHPPTPTPHMTCVMFASSSVIGDREVQNMSQDYASWNSSSQCHVVTSLPQLWCSYIILPPSSLPSFLNLRLLRLSLAYVCSHCPSLVAMD